LAKELNLPLVATNDLHYTHEHDAKAHEALLAIQSGSTLLEPTYDNGGSRFAFSGSGYYLKSPQEMRELFRDHPEACDNTLLIAERCEVSFNTGANYMPRFPCPPGETRPPGWSRKLIRASSTAIPKAFRTRSGSRRTMSWASSPPWASPATSWWWPTSSTGPRTTASG
jgi:DNA polymerase III alpha subunit